MAELDVIERKDVRFRQEVEYLREKWCHILDQADKWGFSAHCERPRNSIDNLPRKERLEILDLDGISPHKSCVRGPKDIADTNATKCLLNNEIKNPPVRAEKDGVAHMCVDRMGNLYG